MGCRENENIQDVYFEAIVTVLGVVYAHRKMPDGGDLYLTPHGMNHAKRLDVGNWRSPNWFTEKRERLDGTSTVYRVPTKPVDGKTIDLVVKNCRVGEDVPGDTQTLLSILNAEFNSPWEEFSLTTELREGKYGNPQISIHTQDPLAIYIPGETMQLWQSGRSRDRLKRVTARHPGIEIDILRQYQLIYGWIPGNDLVECLHLTNASDDELQQIAVRLTHKSIDAMATKGFEVADMKPSHIIIDEADVTTLRSFHVTSSDGVAFLEKLIDDGQYSIVDYELLARTSEYNREVNGRRRQTYLDVQCDRFKTASLPSFLKATTVMDVPYIFGHCESTDGRLWVVGRNGQLFDYFLPERWRCTTSWMLSENSDIFYTLSKDAIHLVWKISRVGELPVPDSRHLCASEIVSFGYNSPFEEFAIAHDLAQKGVGVVYVRAIYRTGSFKIDVTEDYSRYKSHERLLSPDGTPVLQNSYDYITLRGYFNGPDDWVAKNHCARCRPVNLSKAVHSGLITSSEATAFVDKMHGDLERAGYDGSFLSMDDYLIAVTLENSLLRTDSGDVHVRICNFEQIQRRK